MPPCTNGHTYDGDWQDSGGWGRVGAVVGSLSGVVEAMLRKVRDSTVDRQKELHRLKPSPTRMFIRVRLRRGRIVMRPSAWKWHMKLEVK